MNALAGILSVWTQTGAVFYSYFIIVGFYFIATFKLYYDSSPFRNLDNPEGDNFYFAPGITHIVNNAKENLFKNNE
jgi:hypothetical protein